MNSLPYGLTLPGFIAYVQHRAWFAPKHHVKAPAMIVDKQGSVL